MYTAEKFRKAQSDKILLMQSRPKICQLLDFVDAKPPKNMSTFGFC